MSESKIIVWGAGSLRAHRVYWALHEMGQAYTSVPIQSRTGETQTAEYASLNPKQKIPYFRDGDVAISESAAILQYLFRVHGAAVGLFVPENAAQQALSDEWCYTVMTEFDAHPLYIIRRHKYLPETYGEAPAAVASAEPAASVVAAVALAGAEPLASAVPAASAADYRAVSAALMPIGPVEWPWPV